MQYVAFFRGHARSLLPSLLLALVTVAHGADRYDPVTNQLTMPSLSVGSATYSNVVVTVARIVSGPTGTSPNSSGDVYTTANNPADDLLSIASVYVGDTPYYNLVLEVGGLVWIGNVTGGDTLISNQLRISAVQVDDGASYANVLVTIGQILSTAGGMPSVTEDRYNARLSQLLIPAVQEGSSVYTNVTVAIDKVLSVGSVAVTVPDIFPYSFRGTSAIYGSTDGANSYGGGGLIQAADGTFYGTTNVGGLYNQGTVFSITPGGVESVLHSFSGNGALAGSTDGAIPQGGSLILASDGAYYGTTGLGGTSDQGTIFRVTPGGVETVLYSFTGSAGTFPSPNGLIQASDGNLYGTTLAGGSYGAGSVFRMPLAGVLTVLYSFSGAGAVSGSTDGAYPDGALVQGTDGNFYGTTSAGGLYQASPLSGGTVYRISAAGVESVLHSFSGDGGMTGSTDGAQPWYVSLLQASDGNFYGTTAYGGDFGQGAIFQITPAGVERVIYSFSGVTCAPGIGGGIYGNPDGAYPLVGLVQGSDGNLYGTTECGGSASAGTAFKVTTSGVETVLHAFSGGGALPGSDDGGYPVSPLIQASDGNYYGMTSAGGILNDGIVYRLTNPQSAAAIRKRE
jgi:uncharacterized repeat protein (TIGR03803 family)